MNLQQLNAPVLSTPPEQIAANEIADKLASSFSPVQCAEVLFYVAKNLINRLEQERDAAASRIVNDQERIAQIEAEIKAISSR